MHHYFIRMKLNKKYLFLGIIGFIVILFTFSIYGQESEASIPMLLRNIVAELRELRLGLINRECTEFVNMELSPIQYGYNQNQAFLFPPSNFNYREFEILDLTSTFFCSSNTNQSNVCTYSLNGNPCLVRVAPPNSFFDPSYPSFQFGFDMSSCIPYIQEGTNYHNLTNGTLMNMRDYYIRLKMTRNC